MTIFAQHPAFIPATAAQKKSVLTIIAQIMHYENDDKHDLAEAKAGALRRYITRNKINTPYLMEAIATFGTGPETTAHVGRMTRYNPKNN